MSEADLRAERGKKLELLTKAGMEAYPARVPRTASVSDTLERFETLEASKEVLSVAGRVMSVREHGALIFADLFDGTARIQLVLKKGEAIDDQLFDLFLAAVDQGDFVSATGTSFTTKRGEKSLEVREWQMAAKSVMAMPSEWFGIHDEETRLRERSIAMLLDPDLRAMMIRRTNFWRATRHFLESRGFMEVETPVLETSPGGADARPFITHHNALDIDVYLRISAGELWQKRLLIAGFPKVFEIGRIFRNEGQSREHAQDYTQLETYEAYADMESGMQFVQEMYRSVAQETYGTLQFAQGEQVIDLGAEWAKVDFCATLKEKFNIDPLESTDEEIIAAALAEGIKFIDAPNRARAVDGLWKIIRKTILGPAFLVGVPVYLEPLAKRSKENPNVVERVQVLLGGSEIGKGYSELNDPRDQQARFEEQQKLREAGDDEAQRLDLEYVHDMEYGMPPAFGFGVSERLFAFFENKPIHEVQLFPLLRPKKLE